MINRIKTVNGYGLPLFAVEQAAKGSHPVRDRHFPTGTVAFESPAGQRGGFLSVRGAGPSSLPLRLWTPAGIARTILCAI